MRYDSSLRERLTKPADSVTGQAVHTPWIASARRSPAGHLPDKIFNDMIDMSKRVNTPAPPKPTSILSQFVETFFLIEPEDIEPPPRPSEGVEKAKLSTDKWQVTNARPLDDGVLYQMTKNTAKDLFVAGQNAPKNMVMFVPHQGDIAVGFVEMPPLSYTVDTHNQLRRATLPTDSFDLPPVDTKTGLAGSKGHEKEEFHTVLLKNTDRTALRKQAAKAKDEFPYNGQINNYIDPGKPKFTDVHRFPVTIQRDLASRQNQIEEAAVFHLAHDVSMRNDVKFKTDDQMNMTRQGNGRTVRFELGDNKVDVTASSTPDLSLHYAVSSHWPTMSMAETGKDPAVRHSFESARDLVEKDIKDLNQWALI